MAGNVAVATDCRLSRVLGDPQCDFSATPGTITLKVIGTTGSVEFLVVKVNGVALPGTPASQLDIKIASGKNKIDVVYTFSDPVNGAGELHEVCKGNTLLDQPQANNPAVRYKVCA